MSTDHFEALLSMRKYFDTGATRSYSFRKEKLKILKSAIEQNEKLLHEALYADLKKSPEECWVTETGFLLSEIKNTLRNLKEWMALERKRTNLLNFPSKSYVIREPLGLAFIIGPWNYPLQLLFTPLTGAIAAGNCVLLKASEFAPATAMAMEKLIRENFSPDYVNLISGDGAKVVPPLMKNFRFDHVFYTGNATVGKIIYQMAAEQLVPVTLELGGKSPCVVEDGANIKVAAKRIAMTKFSNSGQMCVAPDFVLVHESEKDNLINHLEKSIKDFFSTDPANNYNYGRIVNEKQFNRLISYLNNGTIIYGGQSDKNKLFIAPTILDKVPEEAPVMNEEIFGPILPVIGFTNKKEAKAIIARHPNPLAFYIFTGSRESEKEWLEIPFGGGCVNNASWHLTNYNLPFGGRGFSGLGKYHGKYSFDTFSHRKSIMKTPTWFDPSIKYPPFQGKLKLFKKII